MSYLVLSEITLSAIQAEATSAHLRHGEHSMLSPHYSNGDRLAILMEEVGEVAHELTYDQDGDRDKLVKELIQVAAMAATWVEFLEGNHAQSGSTSPTPGWASSETGERLLSPVDPDFVPGFGPVPGSGFDLDPGPVAPSPWGHPEPARTDDSDEPTNRDIEPEPADWHDGSDPD